MRAELAGKSAVVTGGSKGIGYSVAESLAAAGVNVVICSRHAEEVDEAARQLSAKGGGKVIGCACDLRQYEEARRLVGRAVEEFGGIDILINNAGVGVFAPIDELAVEDWHSMIETNLNGVFYASHAAIPHMKEKGSGWIINVASLAGKNPFAGGAAYNASKFGLVGFSEAMMMDVRHYGIRVSYIMPGRVATWFNDHTPSEADAWKIQPEDIGQIVVDLLEMPERTLPSRIEVRPSRPPKK